MSDARRVVSLNPPFAAQFDPDGDGYIYRRAYSGAAIRVSAAERDAFVKAFNRLLVLQVLVMIVSLIAVVILTIRFASGPGGHPFVWVVGGTSAITAVGVLCLWAAWQAPNKALAGRDVIAPPFSRAEARRVGWAKMSWAQVGFGVFWAIFLASRGLARSSAVAPWIWFSMGAALFLGSCAAAVMKLRASRQAISSPPE